MSSLLKYNPTITIDTSFKENSSSQQSHFHLKNNLQSFQSTQKNQNPFYHPQSKYLNTITSSTSRNAYIIKNQLPQSSLSNKIQEHLEIKKDFINNSHSSKGGHSTGKINPNTNNSNNTEHPKTITQYSSIPLKKRPVINTYEKSSNKKIPSTTSLKKSNMKQIGKDEQQPQKTVTSSKIDIANLLLNANKNKTQLNIDILNTEIQNFENAKHSNSTNTSSSLSSKKGNVIAYGANTHQGLVRNYNEDRVSIIFNMKKPPNFSSYLQWPKVTFFAIYDGHGGNTCSDYLRDNLHKLICQSEFFPMNIPKAIQQGFAIAEKKFINGYALKDANVKDRSGSCAIITLVINGKIYIANCGDSRAVMSINKGMNYKDITIDHKPNEPKEKKRIEQNGGKVYQSQIPLSKENNHFIVGPYRVVPGRLSVSRTIGDVEAKKEKYGGLPNVIISEPDIFEYDLTKKNIDFIVMGCDGIFDQMSSKEVIECAWMVLKEEEKGNIHERCGKAVDLIIKGAMVRKSFDNVTCLIIMFEDLIAGNKKTNNECINAKIAKRIYDENVKVSVTPKKETEIHNEMSNYNTITTMNNISKQPQNENNINTNNKAFNSSYKQNTEKLNNDPVINKIPNRATVPNHNSILHNNTSDYSFSTRKTLNFSSTHSNTKTQHNISLNNFNRNTMYPAYSNRHNNLSSNSSLLRHELISFNSNNNENININNITVKNPFGNENKLLSNTIKLNNKPPSAKKTTYNNSHYNYKLHKNYESDISTMENNAFSSSRGNSIENMILKKRKDLHLNPDSFILSNNGVRTDRGTKRSSTNNSGINYGNYSGISENLYTGNYGGNSKGNYAHSTNVTPQIHRFHSAVQKYSFNHKERMNTEKFSEGHSTNNYF